MKRVSTKIGDIFCVEINNNSKRYFQYITNDSKQLNSDVIRVFKKLYPIELQTDLLDIINDEIFFYAHCVTKWGVKLNYWDKVGNVKEVGEFNHILFRDTNDYGIRKGGEHIKISNNWYVWRIGDNEFERVGELVGDNRNAEIGMVINPESIVYKIVNGIYDFPFYPNYE